MRPSRPLVCRLAPALALLAVTATAGARAELQLAERFDAGAWQGFAYRDTATAGLGHCTVQAVYEAEQVLAFVRSDDGFSIAFTDPRWQLRRGGTYGVLMGVDDGWAKRLTGTATAEQALRVDLGFDGEAVEALRRGEILTVLAEDAATRFALSGTSRAVLDLERCYLRHSAVVGTDTLPRAAPVSAPDQGPRPQGVDRGTPAQPSPYEVITSLRAAPHADGGTGVTGAGLGLAGDFFLAPDGWLSLCWDRDARQATAAAPGRPAPPHRSAPLD